MSNDLISRSQVEKLLRVYADDVGCNREEYELANEILKAVCFLSDVENIPTAYDVDKVVEQIKKATDEHGLVDYINDKPVIKKEKAIEIVKVGGKYE